MPAGRPPRWEDLDRIGWLAARARSARRGGTRGHACTCSHTYIGTCPRAYICAAGGVSLLLGSSTTGGNRMLCSWAQENHRNTWSSERKGDFRHRHGQTGHLDEDSPTSGSSPGRGDAQRTAGSCRGHPPPVPGAAGPPGDVRGEVPRDTPGSPRCHPPTPAGTTAPLSALRGPARPEVGLLLSEGCRQGLGTSR